MRTWRSIAGPAAAATAISVGLLVVVACGDGTNDHVVPPPLKSGLSSAASAVSGSSTFPKVTVPPSPTWRVATEQPSQTPLPTDATTTRTTTRTTTKPRTTTTTESPTTTEEDEEPTP